MNYDQNKQGFSDDQNKQGPSDGSEEDIFDKQDKKEKSADEEFEEELKKLEEKRKEQEAERKKELERMRDDARKKREEETKQQKEQKTIAGQPTQTKKVFEHKKDEGVFRHHKLTNFSASKKIDKALKKVRGVPLKKKLEFTNALKAYNPAKSVLLKKDLEDFSRGLKYRRFTGAKFNKMKKTMDPRELKFKKREIDKIKRELTGKEDPHKYQRRDSALNKPERNH